MAGTPQVFTGSTTSAQTAQYRTKWAYYTGKNINATAGSRTAITGAVPIGACMVYDTYGHDSGPGSDVTQPQTNFLNTFAGIVVGGEATERAGAGKVELVSAADWIRALVLGNLTAPITDATAAQRLGPVAGQWYLGIITKSVADADANAAALAKCVAHSWLTQNNASAALTAIRLIGLGNSV